MSSSERPWVELERHDCTSEDPWTLDKIQFAVHPDAREVGEQRNGWPAGDVVTMVCPHCRHRWEQELPQ